MKPFSYNVSTFHNNSHWKMNETICEREMKEMKIFPSLSHLYMSYVCTHIWINDFNQSNIEAFIILNTTCVENAHEQGE